MVHISSLHPRSIEVRSIFDSDGNKGNSAIFIPILVNKPSSSKAPRAYNYSNEFIRVWTGGGSIKSKVNRSLIPIAFKFKTVVVKLVLYISGTLEGSISFL